MLYGSITFSQRDVAWPFVHDMRFGGLTLGSQVGEEAQQSVIRKVFQQVAQRPDSFCNYLEGRYVHSGESCPPMVS